MYLRRFESDLRLRLPPPLEKEALVSISQMTISKMKTHEIFLAKSDKKT